MLSESDKDLLTAFVDGEMSRRQRKAVLRLLHQSSEARAFLRDLQENVHLFKVLPHHKLEDDFAAHVLDEIAARRLKPQPLSVRQPGLRRPLWIGTAAAAAILLAAGLWLGLRGSGEGEGSLASVARDRELIAVERTVLAFKDLAAKVDTLRFELEREPRIHLDVSVRHSTRAVQQMVEVLQSNKVELVMSPVAEISLKKNQPKTQYLVYAEGLRAEEIVAMLQRLGADKSKAAVEAGFDQVIVGPLDSQDRQQLTQIAGLQTQRRADDEKKEQPKAKMPSFAPERFAVVLTNEPDPGHKLDAHVQAFLSSRRELSPGAMQVLVVFNA